MHRNNYPKAVPKSKRWIYEIADHTRKVVYVGLTCNPRKRFDQHRKNRKMLENFEGSVNPVIITGLLSVEKARTAEADFIEYFRLIGYTVVNRAKAGSIGSPDIYWTVELCRKAANTFQTRSDFMRGNLNAYAAAVRNNWLDVVCDHMVPADRTQFLTRDFCAAEAAKFTRRSDFAAGSNAAYTKARKRGWLSEMCSHMQSSKKPHGYWTLDKCQEVANSFQTLTDFRNKENTVYVIASRNGWIERISTHMTPLTKRTYSRRLTPIAA